MNKNTLRDLTRGGQITLHSMRMLAQVLRDTACLGLCFFGLALIILGSVQLKNIDVYMIGQSIEATLKIQLMGKAVKHSLKAPNGRPISLKAVDFMKSPDRHFYVARAKRTLITVLWQSALSSSVLSVLFLVYLHRKGKKNMENVPILGQVRLPAKDLKKYLKKLGRASEFEIAGVPLVAGSEFQHLLLAGSTGTGKSLCMQELMTQVRSRGERAIVYDIDGAFISQYYRPHCDILLNPLDERSAAWNLWQECRDPADFESAAHSLIATPAHSDLFWIDAARSVFAAAALTLAGQNKCRNHLLLEPLFSKDLKSLGALLAHSPAEALLAEKNEKTALSIKATLSTYCKSLSYLNDEGPLFSIRRWIEEDQRDSWIFVASNAQKIDALKPLMSLWLEMIIKAQLSLDPTEPRRLWLFLDELASLQRVPSLGTVLSRGRKYGAAIVAAIQDIHQLYALYGKHEAEALSSLFNTKVFFRCQEPESSRWMSQVMGSIERFEQKEGFSYGAHAMRDGVSMHQERLKEALIKETEFLTLPDCEAFLKLAGNYPLTQLQFKVKKHARFEPAFVPIPKPFAVAPTESPKGSQSAAADEQGLEPAENSAQGPSSAFEYHSHGPYGLKKSSEREL